MAIRTVCSTVNPKRKDFCSKILTFGLRKTVTLQPHKAETPMDRYSYFQASLMQFVGESLHEIQTGTGDNLCYHIIELFPTYSSP